MSRTYVCSSVSIFFYSVTHVLAHSGGCIILRFPDDIVRNVSFVSALLGIYISLSYGYVSRIVNESDFTCDACKILIGFLLTISPLRSNTNRVINDF